MASERMVLEIDMGTDIRGAPTPRRLSAHCTTHSGKTPFRSVPSPADLLAQLTSRSLSACRSQTKSTRPRRWPPCRTARLVTAQAVKGSLDVPEEGNHDVAVIACDAIAVRFDLL